jgi:hypothetical protein
MSESDAATLTLSASGPAIVETETETDGVTVRETRETTLEASLDIDAETLADVGDVYRAGVVLPASDVAERVLEHIDVAPGETYRVPEADAWDVTLSGRVDAYAEVALAAADERRGSRSKTLLTAAQILDTVAEEYATDERPRLALYDLVATTECEAFAPETIARQLVEADSDADGEREARIEAGR